MSGGRHRVPLRAFLWEYLGHPDDETPGRRRVLYALVALRLGLGLAFLLRGGGAVFATAPGDLALRLGDPARLGLAGAAADTALFIVGCTELGVGALLLAGAFTRVSAVTGAALLALALALGARAAPRAGTLSPPLNEADLVAALTVVALAGLAVLIIAGSPFLSADRALDKLEEEERDRAPATLPPLAERAPAILRAGILAATVWVAYADPPAYLALLAVIASGLAAAISPPIAALIAAGLLAWMIVAAPPALVPLALAAIGVGVALLVASWPRAWPLRRS